MTDDGVIRKNMAAYDRQPSPGDDVDGDRAGQRARPGFWQRSRPLRRLAAGLALVLVPVAMLLAIVYVGAVAVLFLFVVMMLDVDFAELRGQLTRYMPLGLLIAVMIWSRHQPI